MTTPLAFGPAPDQDGVCNGAAGDYSSVNYLTSPTITVGAGADVANSQRLSFTHNVRTELGFDGGTVKIQKNGAGPFTVVPAAAYVFNPPSTLATTRRWQHQPALGTAGLHRHRRRQGARASGVRRSSTWLTPASAWPG